MRKLIKHSADGEWGLSSTFISYNSPNEEPLASEVDHNIFKST